MNKCNSDFRALGPSIRGVKKKKWLVKNVTSILLSLKRRTFTAFSNPVQMSELELDLMVMTIDYGHYSECMAHWHCCKINITAKFSHLSQHGDEWNVIAPRLLAHLFYLALSLWSSPHTTYEGLKGISYSRNFENQPSMDHSSAPSSYYVYCSTKTSPSDLLLPLSCASWPHAVAANFRILSNHLVFLSSLK